MGELGRVQLIRIGSFLAATVLALFLVVFMLSRSERMFGRSVVLHASFINAGGLVGGAPVRLAGVDIGVVKAIHFSAEPKRTKVDVDLSLEAKYLPRIRRDSAAFLISKGLLGDMIIDITLGSEGEPPLQDGDKIATVETAGLKEVVAAVESVIGRVNDLTLDVDTRLKVVLTDQLAKDLGRIAHSTATLLEGVAHGPGLANRLIYDPALAVELADFLRDSRQVALEAKAAVAEIEIMMHDIRHGDGLIQALIYDPRGGQAVAELERSSRDLAGVADAIRNGPGVLHSLVYQEEKRNLVQDLSEASRVIRKVALEVEQGKGTVGGLLKDPTVYQDLTTILGNLKRNELLKALVRFTISNDGLERPVLRDPNLAAAQPPRE